MGCCLFVCLFVCQFLNRCIYKNLETSMVSNSINVEEQRFIQRINCFIKSTTKNDIVLQ